MKNKIQITQKKCIQYCLQLEKIIYVSKNEYDTLNWLPVKDRFSQSINSIIFKYFTNPCPSCLNEVFKSTYLNNLRTRNSYLMLHCPFEKTNTIYTAPCFHGPSIWNKTPEFLKKPTALILSNITLQRHYLTQLK